MGFVAEVCRGIGQIVAGRARQAAAGFAVSRCQVCQFFLQFCPRFCRVFR